MRARILIAATLVASVAWAAAPVAAPVSAQPPASGSRLVLHDVHTDVIDVQYTDGRLRLQTRIGSAPYTYKQAEEVIFQLKESSALEVPGIPEYAFIGAPGDIVWVAPEIQVDGLLFAGWDTQSLSTGVFAGDQLDLELKQVSGPGRLEMFQTGSFGEPIRIFSSTDSAYKKQAVPVHTHAHTNWVFSALGRYELTFQATATLAGGGQVASDPVSYTWVVGDSVTPAPTATELAATVADDQVTLRATVQPERAMGWIAFRNGDTSLGHAAVEDGVATLTAALAAGTHQMTAHYIPKYDNDFAASVAAPVTVTVEGPPSLSPSPSPSLSLSPSPSQSSSTSPPAAPTTTTSVCVPKTTTVPIIADGHVDVLTRLSNGRTDIFINDKDPANVVLHLMPQAATTVPGSGFDFLGSPGSKVWQIPQTQRSGIIWLGWNTESVSSPVQWSLTKVSGPGRVAVYEYSSFGQPRIIFNSGDGLPDSYTIPAGTHAHGNWAFTMQGVYKLTFRQQAGSTSDTATMTIVVGDVDPRPHAKRTTGCGPLARTGESIATVIGIGSGLLALGAVLVFALRRRRVAG